MSSVDAVLADAAGAPRLLVAVDFDGTLAEIVDRPEDAVPVPGSVRALRELASGGIDVALITGRTLDDLKERIGPLDGVILVGSHGAEWDGGSISHPDIASVEAKLKALAANYPGSRVESKAASVTVHSRMVDPGRVQELVEAVEAAGKDAGFRVERGKAVIEVHLTDRTKGTALRDLRDRLCPNAVIYIGDDTTDEEAFAALEEGDIGIKVGDGPTLAGWRVETPGEVVRLLDRLAERRSPGDV